MKKERKIWYEAVDKLLIFAWRRTKVKISWWRTHTGETAKKQHQGVLKWRGERILWWRTIWHHGKDHTSYKEDAFIIAAADDAITREEMFSPLMMKTFYLITNFQNLTNLLPLAIFLLEIMFVLKLKKYLYFIKLCIYEKR